MSEDKQKPPTLVQEILDKFSTLITAAFGLVAALAWNAAIQAFFREFFGEQETFMPMVVYASVVTIIAVIITFIVARAITKAKEKSSNLGL
jgi:ABC-type spermidine/putrescine transport system permease subunit I